MHISYSTLKNIPSSIHAPTYDRANMELAIAHIGVGGFHRSHQAVFLDDLLNQKFTNWGICGIGVMSQDKLMRDALKEQDFLYTVVERSAQEDKARIVGAVGNILLSHEDLEAVLDKLASPSTKVISLTITEKGYFYDSVTGKLNEQHPAIFEDLKSAHPKTAIGCIVESLRRRFVSSRIPVTIMSCDNLIGNGEVARHVIVAFARLRDPKLAKWIEQNITFPNSMVDRITPVTTSADKKMIEEKFGITDEWPVVCEPFRQWIIEDKFCQGRPPWEKVGVEIVEDVTPYEKMKVRLLNGGHSALAYLGYLLGYRLVHEAAQDPFLSLYLRRLMDEEVTPTLPSIPRIDLNAYKDMLLIRFGNPAICDQVQRLAMDGSQKLPNNLVACVRDQLQRGGSIHLLALGFAGWMRYLKGIDEEGRPIEIIDPLGKRLQELAQQENQPLPLLIEEVFGKDVSQSKIFIQELQDALASLYQIGTKDTLKKYLNLS